MPDPTASTALGELIGQGVLGIALALSLMANIYLLRALMKSYEARINDAQNQS